MTVDLSDRGPQLSSPLGTPVGNVPPDATIPLLQAILRALRETGERMATPAKGLYLLAPDAGTSPNGRILVGAPKLRLERMVLIAAGVITFTVQTSSASLLALPATPGAFTVIDLPLGNYLIDRGASLQVLANLATWSGYAIGYTE